MEDLFGSENVLKGFVPVPKKKEYHGLVAGLEAALWTSPAEAMDWGHQMCQESGHLIELRTEYRFREYKNGVLQKEYTKP